MGNHRFAKMPGEPENAGAKVATSVIVHPLVLLSTVDHYSRGGGGPRKRVMGVLLGMCRRVLWMLPTALLYHLMRMINIRELGSWTMIFWKPCTACSPRLQLRRKSWGGIPPGLKSSQWTSRSTISSRITHQTLYTW